MTTDIFVYITGKLPCSIGELEDSIEDALAGIGEVTGSGVGASRSNVDITVRAESDTQIAVARTREVLARLGIIETAARFDVHRGEE